MNSCVVCDVGNPVEETTAAQRSAYINFFSKRSTWSRPQPLTNPSILTLVALAISTKLSTDGDSTPRSILLMNTVERSAFSGKVGYYLQPA